MAGRKLASKVFRDRKGKGWQSRDFAAAVPATPSALAAHSRDFYLTLISIIQSLVLGLLLTGVFKQLSMDLSHLPGWGYFLRALASFLLAILVWHEYAIGAATDQWAPGFLDSLIPFFFGVVQFAMIEFASPTYKIDVLNLSNEQGWLLFVFLFCCVGALAYWNQDANRKRENSGYEMPRQKLKFEYLGFSCSVTFGLLIGVIVGTSLWYNLSSIFGHDDIVDAALVLGAVCLQLFASWIVLRERSRMRQF